MSSSNESKNVFEGVYYSSKEMIDQIKDAYSSPRNCVHSYWCLIPMILLILLGIFLLLVIYYFFMNIIKSCCCCCFLCKPTRYVRSQPTVLVQPAMVPPPPPPYPVYSYKEPVWHPAIADIRQRDTDMYYDSPPKRIMQPSPPRKSSWRKKSKRNKKQFHLVPRERAYSVLTMNSNNLENKENLGDFWVDFEVESPSKEEIQSIHDREYLSELSSNSNFSYDNSGPQIEDSNTPNLRTIRYIPKTNSHPNINRSGSPSYRDVYEKNRPYSGF